MKLRSHGRYDFNPLPSRPAGCWPGGARIAFYVALNLEQYSFGDGLVEDLVPPLGQPDVMNYSWRDWGNRIGAWRLLAMFRELGFAPSLLVNTVLYETAPGLIEAFRSLGCAVVASTQRSYPGCRSSGRVGRRATPSLCRRVRTVRSADGSHKGCSFLKRAAAAAPRTDGARRGRATKRSARQGRLPGRLATAPARCRGWPCPLRSSEPTGARGLGGSTAIPA